jgi:hypothetical protein
LPAMRVVSTCPACSAGTFSNLMVMFGCSSWNCFASFFIVGELPTQEKNVTVVGSLGSGTGPAPWPCWVLPGEFSVSPPHPARLSDATMQSETTEAAFPDF